MPYLLLNQNHFMPSIINFFIKTTIALKIKNTVNNLAKARYNNI